MFKLGAGGADNPTVRRRWILVVAVAVLGTACGSRADRPGAQSGSETLPAPVTTADGTAADAMPTTALAAEATSDEWHLSGDGPPATVAPGKFSWAWGTSCTVPWSERVDNSGQSIEADYTARLTTTGEGYNLALDIQRAESPMGQLPPQAIASMSGLIPDVSIDGDGYFVGIVDARAWLERVSAAMGQEAEALTALPDEALQQMTQKVAAYTWSLWVDMWLGLGDYGSGAFSADIPVGAYTAHIEYDELGQYSDGTVHVRLRTTVGGVQAAAALRDSELMGALGDLNGFDPSEVVDDFERVTTHEAILDPDGVRPVRTYWSMQTTATKDGETRTETETRVGEFDWSAAVGCGLS